MKKGFEVYIQDGLSTSERNQAIKFINKFISKTCGDEKFRYFGEKGGGYTTSMWRGRFGITLSDDLVFRRISKNQRKFAVVRVDTLEVHNDKALDKAHFKYRDIQPNGVVPKMCACPRHKASLRVRFKTKPSLSLYAKIGDVKG